MSYDISSPQWWQTAKHSHALRQGQQPKLEKKDYFACGMTFAFIRQLFMFLMNYLIYDAGIGHFVCVCIRRCNYPIAVPHNHSRIIRKIKYVKCQFLKINHQRICDASLKYTYDILCLPTSSKSYLLVL